jgi:tetratricopeptide (TPR) repeat protein
MSQPAPPRTREPTRRSPIPPVVLIALAALATLPHRDIEAASRPRASSMALSRLLAAAASVRDPAQEAKIRWELARVLRDAGRRDEAIAEYRKALALDAGLDDARGELARLLLAAGRAADAANEYQVLVERRPEDAAARRELAETWVHAKQVDRAIQELERLASRRPSDLAVRRRLVELFEVQNRWADLIAAATAVLALAPDDRQVRFRLANALVATQRAAEAVPHLRRIVREDPARADATLLLADALSWQGDYRDAVALYTRALEQTPSDTRARLGLALVLDWTDRIEEAQREYETILGIDPRSADALEGLARTRLASRMPYSAIDLYRRAAAVQPGRREAALGIANALGVAGEFGKARAAYAAILEDDPKEIRAWSGMAEVLLWAQRLDEAESWLAAALRGFPDHPHLLLGDAEVRLAERRFLEAADLARRAGASGADPARSAVVEADALRQRGRTAEAREVLSLAASRRSQDVRLLTGLGRVSLQEGKPAAAAAEFRRALAIDPGFLDARYGLWSAEGGGERTNGTRPTDARGLARLCELLAEDRKPAEASEACRAALALNPDLVGTRFTLAEIAAARGDFPTAADIYRRLLDPYPDNVKARIGLARVLSWSQRFADAVAEYDRLVTLDPRDPVARRERARVLGWAQRFPEAREGYDALLRDPPTGPEEPLRRLLEGIRLEREGKDALWLRRYATAIDRYDRLLQVEPVNQEARFDRAQALSQLGLWRSAEQAYRELLAIEPSHRQAAIARERAEIEQGPKTQGGYEYFQSQGRGTLANLRRQKASLSVGLPLPPEGSILAGEYAYTDFPTGDFGLHAYSISLDGRLSRLLTGSLRATHNDYLKPLRSNQNYEATLKYRPLDLAGVTINYRREDIHENAESLSQQIQRDIVTARAEMGPTVRNAVGAAYSYAHYSDGNDRHAFELFASHQFSLYPRVLKATYTLSYQDFARPTIFPPEGSSIPTVHPYFAPSNFFTNAVTVEWRHYVQRELFLGAKQCYYAIQWTPAIESIDAVFSNTIQGEVLCDLTQRFTVSARGLLTRSSTYEADHAVLQLHYRF